MSMVRAWASRWMGSRWTNWPAEAYQTKLYQDRLAAVREHLGQCLDDISGPANIVSLCAGDGRDVIGTLELRRENLFAWLVEQNRRSVADGRLSAERSGLGNRVVFVEGDATSYETYRDIPPGDVVLACGVWGHVPPRQRASLVRALSCLCRAGGAVIWTRGVAKGLQGLREIETHFDSPSWALVRTSFTPDGKWAINTYRYGGPAQRRPASGRIFDFRLGAGHAREAA